MRIKICGITRPADAELAARLGADAIGLNFYEKSPRFVGMEQIKLILQALPPFVEPVGVFVAPIRRELDDAAERFGLWTFQVHAFTIPDLAAERQPLWRLILAQGLSAAGDIQRLDVIKDTMRMSSLKVVAVLADASVAGLHGGTGRSPPWDLIAGWNPVLPLILAGGLTSENVAEAIRSVRPYAVDVASGVESAPGIKDAEKMKRFISNAREAAVRYL